MATVAPKYRIRHHKGDTARIHYILLLDEGSAMGGILWQKQI